MSLALATLRNRWPALAGAFLALSLGAALAIAAISVIASVDRAVPKGPQRYAAAPIVVSAPPELRSAVGRGEDREVEADPNRVPAALDPALLARLPGRAIADRSFTLRAGAETLTGRPWSIAAAAPYRLVSGRAPAARDEVVATTGQLGERRSIVTPAARPEVVRVVGIAGGGAAYEQPLFFTDARAAQLAPRIDAIAVWPRSALPAVEHALHGEVALTGTARAKAEHDPLRDAIAGASVLLGLMMVTIAFVAVFAIASSFSFSVALRRRELGLLRAIGATPRQIRRLVLREAALVAAAASVTGAAGSLLAGPLLGRWLVAKGLAPGGLRVMPSPLALAIGAGLMLFVGVTGAWSAARRAARVRPADALRDAAVDRGVMTVGRFVVGVPAIGGALALLATGVSADAEAQLPLTLGEAALLILGFGMLAPIVLPRLIALLVAPVRGAGPLLVRQHARAGVRRTAATAAPVLVAVALTGSLAAMIDSIDASERAATRARIAPGAVAIEGDLTQADVDALRAAAPVGATLEADLRVRGPEGVTPYRAIGADRAATALMLRVRALQGSLDALSGDSVALGELTAKTLRVRAGDRIGVWLPDGTRRARTLKVVAVVADGFSSTGMYVPRGVLAGHLGGIAATTVYAPTRTPALERAAAERGLQLAVAAPHKVGDVTDSSNMNPLALLAILGVAVVYVALSLAATAATGTVARAASSRCCGSPAPHDPRSSASSPSRPS